MAADTVVQPDWEPVEEQFNILGSIYSINSLIFF